MKNCIFCQISENPTEESYRIFYSDENFLGMLVSHPETRGHFILFPKTHYSELSELKGKGAFFELAIKLAEEKTNKLNAKAYVLKLNNKLFKLEDNPLHVGHIHIHVIPRYFPNDSELNRVIKLADKEDLLGIKNEIL